MKFWYSFSFIDVYRVLYALNYLKYKDNQNFITHYERLLEKTIGLTVKIPQ